MREKMVENLCKGHGEKKAGKCGKNSLVARPPPVGFFSEKCLFFLKENLLKKHVLAPHNHFGIQKTW